MSPNNPKKDLRNLLFTSVLSVRNAADFGSLPQGVQDSLVARFRSVEASTPEVAYSEQGMFYAEVSKVLAIVTGMFVPDETGHLMPKVHVLYEVDEVSTINAYYSLVERLNVRLGGEVCVAGFNVKRFHIPFISRRSLVNSITIPDWFQTQGKKPWEATAFDVMEAWDFGGRNDFTSLAAMAHAFNLQGVDLRPYYVADNLYHGQAEASILDVTQGSREEVMTTMRLVNKLFGVS